MKKDDIETIEQTLNNYLFEHMPEYHVTNYPSLKNRLFVEPIVGNKAAAQYIHAENKIRVFYVNQPSEELKTALRVFCLLHDIEFTEGIRERGLSDDKNYAIRA